MKRLSRWLFALLLPLLATFAMAADKEYMEGAEYLRLANPQPTSAAGKVEVVELFMYTCPHCRDLEPNLNAWLETKPDDVVFVRIPAIFRTKSELYAKAYFTAEQLGVLEKIHTALFDALHVKKQKIIDAESLRDFFVAQGVDPTGFDKAFNSFSVSVKVNNARLMTRRYAITGVPTLIVNGKFSTSGTLAGSRDGIIDVVNYLVAQERNAGDSARAAAEQP